MPELFNSSFSPAELRRLTGTLDQLAGIRMVEYADGKARGMRAADVYTGTGFRFTVWLDRAMDIGPAEFAGKPLAWLHPALGTPAQYELCWRAQGGMQPGKRLTGELSRADVHSAVQPDCETETGAGVDVCRAHTAGFAVCVFDHADASQLVERTGQTAQFRGGKR